MSSIHVVCSEITGALQDLSLQGLLGSQMCCTSALLAQSGHRLEGQRTVRNPGLSSRSPGKRQPAHARAAAGESTRGTNSREASLPRIQLLERSARLRAVPVAPEGDQARSTRRPRSLMCRTRQNENTGPSFSQKASRISKQQQQSIETQHGISNVGPCAAAEVTCPGSLPCPSHWPTPAPTPGTRAGPAVAPRPPTSELICWVSLRFLPPRSSTKRQIRNRWKKMVWTPTAVAHRRGLFIRNEL